MSGKKRTADRPLYKKYLGAALLGGGIGMAVQLAVLCLFALLMSSGGLTGEAIPFFSGAALCVGAFAGGFAVSRRLREKGLLMGAGSGIWMFLIYLLLGLLFGRVQAAPALLSGLLLSAVSAAVGGVVGVNLKIRRFR